MIGQHEALTILECRRVQHEESVISDADAREIASWWHSPSPHSVGITAFSHSGKRLPSLRSEVERELGTIRAPYGSATDRLLLRSLLNWIIANPIEVIRYEQVIFLQGDDADDVLKMVYPEWEYASASIGWPDGAESALIEVKGWDYGEPTDVPDSYERPDASYGSSIFEDDDHAMAWNFGLGWVSLSRKVKEVG